MTPGEFIALIAPSARASMVETRVPASFTIAQAALESAWGKSALATEGCNLFGVKADAAWLGNVIEMPTRECLKGRWVTVVARWRKYKNYRECIDDHAAFLHKNPRYAPAFLHDGDGVAFAQAVADAGYATDPAYASKVIATMKSHDMAQFDQPQGATA